MTEEFKSKLHNLIDKNIENYVELLLEAYESETDCASVLHSDLERISIAQTLVGLGYLIDINPLSSLYKGSSNHEYLITEEGFRELKILRPDKINPEDLLDNL